MKERKWGLVLAGGGGKGAYQIGVFKAIFEYGLEEQIVAVSGSSIGALNGALFAQGDVALMESVWKGIEPAEILDVQATGTDLMETLQEKFNVFGEFLGSISLNEYLKKAKEEGICSREGLLKILEEEIDLQKVIHNSKKIFATIASMENSIPVAKYCLLNGKTEEEIKKILLASSALPVVYDAVDINGVFYRDGGLADNVPATPIIRQGIENLIVVQLKPKDIRIGRNEDGLVNYLEISPSHSLGDFVTGTIDFTHHNILYRMSLGYYDAMRMLKEVELIETGIPTKELDLKMQLMENHNRAISDNRRGQILETVQYHLDKFRELEERFR
ncbi:MAG: patatin-like phospholipase family protein [Lachnospiraceae bacterium]|nr:patatin-like phospholipase family protein [Lachnospiraceae bacterium]